MNRRTVMTGFLIAGGLLFGFVILLMILSRSAQRPSSLGVANGRLAPCPDSPNCVCTQAEDRQHWIEPLSVTDEIDAPIRALAEITGAMPGASIVTQTESYLHVEFRSRLFRFCDDVEFLLDESGDRIHFRSASRVGRSDLGVNRQRMEEIRGHWNAAVAAGRQQLLPVLR